MIRVVILSKAHVKRRSDCHDVFDPRGVDGRFPAVLQNICPYGKSIKVMCVC